LILGGRGPENVRARTPGDVAFDVAWLDGVWLDVACSMSLGAMSALALLFASCYSS